MRIQKDKDEDPSTRSDRGLKKRKTSKDAKVTKGPKAKESQSGSSKGTKSQSKSSRKFVQSEEPEFVVADLDIPQDQEENLGKGDVEPKEKTPQQGQIQSWLMTLASSADKPSKTFDELMSTPIDFSAFIMNDLKINNLNQETLLGPAFRLLKGTRSNYAELEYDFEECIEDMVLNIWVPVKVAYDKHVLWGISHWREQRKSFNGSNNDLYRFKEGDFPRLRINDIEDMLLLVVQNRLTNLSGDDVSDFAIALRMFTRSLVIQKRVKDLQLRVKSYQKKINVTKPETTKSGIRIRDPYTPYQDPQGFIYVVNNGRNMLMRSDELYKFSDRTLTGLQTSLDDITKNIRMEYLPKRRWSTLEKKRANIMIKAIDKQLKERRLMRSLEKFVGERHYETDPRLLQRKI
ncbi:hypothetical protein Tco_1454868 [Tanacetum coccineum]